MKILPPDPKLRLAAIVESSDDAIVSKDLNGIITSWNRGAEMLFGYLPDEAVGQSITILIPPDRLSEEDVVLDRVRRGLRVEPFDTVRWRKDGTLVDVSVAVSPIHDESGVIVGASKIARNISDRKRIETQLQDLQHRLMGLAVASASILASPSVDAVLSAAIDLARDVVAADGYALWRADRDGAFRIVRSFGVSEDFAGRIIGVHAAEEGTQSVPFAEPLVCEDVETSPLIADMRDAYRREGIASMVVFPLLIRGRRAATMVFYSRRRRRFRDEDVQVGRALANIAAASLTTAELSKLVDARARDEEHRRILKALKLTSYMCVPLATQGRAFGAITFVSAESGREYGEGDLRIAREIAARASMAVENARSYARATEASRLKDEFLATLSHELRTPLNAVLGYARMLRLGTMPAEKAKQALDVVERNATSLKQIIEDVLDVSRIVAGRLRLNVEPVDLPGIMHEACATVMPAADAKGVRIETVIDPLTTAVSGDPDRLQQIVWNLMSNAIKFTPRGGRVQLRLSRVNSHVEIAVSDTGGGIAPEFLPFVFERFRQADATFAREHGGLGLGLAIVKQLAELHGGTASASSEGLGRGATFVVRLPMMIVRPPAEAGPREQPHSDRAIPTVETVPRLDGVHVLAVDDERDSLELLRSALEGVGATVTAAASASAALDVRRQHAPDVMVADIGMPGMDGLQLIRAIRQLDEPARSIPAAALTAYARSQDRVTSLASGFQMHLVKPIDPLELIVAVSTLAPRRIGA